MVAASCASQKPSYLLDAVLDVRLQSVLPDPHLPSSMCHIKTLLHCLTKEYEPPQARGEEARDLLEGKQQAANGRAESHSDTDCGPWRQCRAAHVMQNFGNLPPNISTGMSCHLISASVNSHHKFLKQHQNVSCALHLPSRSRVGPWGSGSA